MPDPTPELQLLVVGGGKMGEALLGGIFASGWARPESVLVVEPVEARRTYLLARFPGVRVAGELPGPGPGSSADDDTIRFTAEGALVAVKPAQVAEICERLASLVPRVLSIAAGVPTKKMEKALRRGGGEGAPSVAVVRAMPNTPALVGVGASAIAGGADAAEADLAWAEAILRSVGVVERVDEKLLDAVTGLSGSGPAYLFLVAEAMIDAGVLLGLPRAVAATLAGQTIRGAGTLLVESGEEAAALRANVTSPGGTTAAGLRRLEAAGVRSAVIDAVVAAAERSAELA